ncbi:MAG: adenylosuccinate synthetase, partial [Patescibacteria group bacterium]|nr:adenylosuccinate synthetase [Patescibacteria group bacterium]
MNTTVLRMLWGDEAKAKIIQSLRSNYDMVVRFQGAANAGHTVYHNASKMVLHAIPVGIIYEKISVIAAGCLVDPISLVGEIEEMESMGFDVFSNLKIYSNTTVTTDFEIRLDRAREKCLSGKSSKVGTTGRGIGPSYSNRAYRTAILFEDLFNDKVLLKKLEDLSRDMNPRLKTYSEEKINPKNVYMNLKECATKLQGLIVPPHYIGRIIEGGGSVLFEGAQGALLCPINGSYPFVTSFPVNPALIPISCNIPMKHINKIIGVLKAYPTRVGEGPFPTQIGGKKEEFL